jgi:hypothetical protein
MSKRRHTKASALGNRLRLLGSLANSQTTQTISKRLREFIILWRDSRFEVFKRRISPENSTRFSALSLGPETHSLIGRAKYQLKIGVMP